MKKLFILMLLFVFLFLIPSCKEKEVKSDFDLFIDEYNKHHSEPVNHMEDGYYRITTRNITYSLENDHIIEEQDCTGYLQFAEGSFEAVVSNFSYHLNKMEIKDYTVFDSIEKQVYSYENRYYEELTTLDGNRTTYGCQDLSVYDFNFSWAPTLKYSIFNSLLYLEGLKLEAEINVFNISILVDERTLFITSHYPNGVVPKLRQQVKVYFDENYDIYRLETSAVYIHKQDYSYQNSYFATTVIEKVHDYVPNSEVFDYEHEKNFDDLREYDFLYY